MSGPLLTAAPGTQLVLARHGQTSANLRHALDTLPPGPELTEHGVRQAEELAGRLSGVRIASLRASRALRAQQTAAPIAMRSGLAVQVTDGVQEVYVGELEGRADPEAAQIFDRVYGDWHAGELDEPMPGGETGNEACTRFLNAAQECLSGADGGSVVLVSHGAMLRLVAGRLAAGITGAQANSVPLPNTGVIVLRADPAVPTGWRCSQWDALPLPGADGLPGVEEQRGVEDQRGDARAGS